MVSGWLTHTTDWVALLAFVFIPALATVVVHAVLRRLVPSERLRPHHDVAGFLVAVIGVLYAVVLGFLVVTVWTAFDTAQQTADTEAGKVADAFGFAYGLPQPTRSRVQQLLAQYALEVRDVEWPALRDEHDDPQAQRLLVEVVRTLIAAPAIPTPNLSIALRNESRYEAVVNGMRDVADARRLRLIQAASRLPRALYLSLVIGGSMVLIFVFLFGVESGPVQLIMTATVAGCIGLLLGLIVELNRPYSGAIRVSPEAWTYVIDTMHFDDAAKGRFRLPTQ
jgi:hypothetical protein